MPRFELEQVQVHVRARVCVCVCVFVQKLHKYACLRQLRPRQVRVTSCPKLYETRIFLGCHNVVHQLVYMLQLCLHTKCYTNMHAFAKVHQLLHTCNVLAHQMLHKYACLRQLRPRQVRVTSCPKSYETRIFLGCHNVVHQ